MNSSRWSKNRGGSAEYFPRCSPVVLDGPVRKGGAEGQRRLEGPVRLPEELTAEEDQVGLALGDDRFSLLRTGDQPDRPRGDARLLADPLREGDLVARLRRDRRIGDVSTG